VTRSTSAELLMIFTSESWNSSAAFTRDG
jgi:hypothetical protein